CSGGFDGTPTVGRVDVRTDLGECFHGDVFGLDVLLLEVDCGTTHLPAVQLPKTQPDEGGHDHQHQRVEGQHARGEQDFEHVFEAMRRSRADCTAPARTSGRGTVRFHEWSRVRGNTSAGEVGRCPLLFVGCGLALTGEVEPGATGSDRGQGGGDQSTECATGHGQLTVGAGGGLVIALVALAAVFFVALVVAVVVFVALVLVLLAVVVVLLALVLLAVVVVLLALVLVVLTAFGDGFHAARLGDSEDGHGVAADVDGGVDGDDDLVTTGHTTRTIGACIVLVLGCGVDDVDDGGALGGGRAEDRHRVAADVDGRVDGDSDLVTTGHTTRTIGLGESFRGVCGFLLQDLDDLDTLGLGDPSDGDCVT